MNIVFCINRLGMVGLGATLTSLIRNCSDTKRIKIYFLCAGITSCEKYYIKSLFNEEQFLGGYQFIDFDPSRIFGSFPSLHGDWTTYGRLLISDYLEEDQVLYLDCDLIIELDVLEVEKFDFQGEVLGAVGGGKFKYTLGNKFYIEKIGISPDVEYFNAGVLILDLFKWRMKNIKEQCLELANKYSLELPSHDQSILNIILKGSFAKLSPAFNCEWCADKVRPNVSEKMLLHFVGSPKPWDLFGSFIHNGYQSWLKYSTNKWMAKFGGISTSSLFRTWRIRRSYARCIRNRYLNK
ncbi:glycosyltransferase family 8 protein [Flavisolibacter tropicus]|uniref:Glycosyl transferase n=1 Tax=Flavisolibacter tropicus TaxID=1492898 RepID=A0A172TQV6_9BACT|nr:glycosyltransferase family 8 protein [Flavisolibacter tropicus]ANE49264.1 hypothetical protein SY85_00840 [Flavisolibacter tropicus]